jgi:transcription-repair coupling factor (superfamily II helicase)
LTHPAIRDLFLGLARHPSFQELLRRLPPEAPARLSLSGLTATSQALHLVLLWQSTGRPIFWIVDGNRQAEALAEVVETFFDILVVGRENRRPLVLPALDVLPSSGMSPHSEISEQRGIGLWRLATGRVSIAILPVQAALLRIREPDTYRQLALTLRLSDEVPQEDLAQHLSSIGYQQREPVEMVGEFSVRGGIVDIFPAEAQRPVRIEMFGDSIESIRRFDVETQRSTMKLEDVMVLPLVEHPQPGSERERSPGWEFRAALETPRRHSTLSIPERPVIAWDEPGQIKSAAERLWQRLDADPELARANYFGWDELLEMCAGTTHLELRELELAGESNLHIRSRPSPAFHGNMQLAVSEARAHVDSGSRVVFFAPSTGEIERLADILQEYSMPFQLGLDPSDATPQYLAERAYLAGSVASTYLVKGRVRRGFVLPESQVAIIGSNDLFDTSELVAQPAAGRAAAAAFAADIADLKPGDYVVHQTHGVGRFVGLREIPHGDQKGDFMLLEYAADAKLYVPLTRMDLIEKFRGAGEGAAPPLDRLGGVTWTRTKSRVKAKMRDMADELLKLYAARKMAAGFAFSSDSNWQREFEEAFEFTETRDQLTAIREIKRDMERGEPMDRLLCGDVGYGKTEVAMRAAFKALGDGKQVAVLAPTTVLTFQHFETLKRRFAPFPVRVEMLSRFVPPKDIKRILADVAEGKVDIVVGTHRLLSKDVVFRDLGLLVVDEEQRFGVRHKERLKQMTKNVDVLTMSATPIPRTLHMSLVGLRDMSVIETPPKDRLSIHTVVAHFHPELIRTAIDQEISRGGQVYFLHNRIDTIWERAAFLQQLLPQARIGVGHGQMGEAELEKVLLGFMEHKFDVFVSTTIVENGLDIPLANTMVIENAERYGLSELYQLRGRVGRSNRRAYAYLLVPPEAELTEIARKRLAALKEFSDLGAGFKIAALDLELRGAGNILGGEQHGHIAAVGFDTYLRLLEETVQELKGQPVPLEVRSTLSLGLDIRIPTDYIADENQRLRAYKRLAEIKTREQAAEALAEVEDRYGPAPPALRTLIEFSLLKSRAENLGIESIERRHGAVNVKFHPEARIEPARLMELVNSTPGAQFSPAGILRLPVDAKPDEILASLQQRFEHLAAATL